MVMARAALAWLLAARVVVARVVVSLPARACCLLAAFDWNISGGALARVVVRCCCSLLPAARCCLLPAVSGCFRAVLAAVSL